MSYDKKCLSGFFIFLPLFIFSTCTTSASYQIEKIINKNGEIQSMTEIWGWRGKGLDFYTPLALDIKFLDGRRLFLAFIKSRSFPEPPHCNRTPLRAPFDIWLIGDTTFDGAEFAYYPSDSDIERESSSPAPISSLPIDLIASELKTKLDTVEEVISNYDKIYEFVCSLPLMQADGVRGENIKFEYSDKELSYIYYIRRVVRHENLNKYFKGFDEEEKFGEIFEESREYIYHTAKSK